MKKFLLLFFMLGMLTSSAANNDDIESMVETLLSKMTLEEKIRLSYAQSKFSSPGVARLGVPELYCSDGPHGVRMEICWNSWDHAGWTNDSCTAFPALTCLAATWQPKLAYLYGRMIGEEARYRKKNVLLGPGVNLYRTPLNGRNFEYMGEDPYLVSRMCVPYIQGLQSNGVACCLKHYALNEQETFRDHVDVRVSDRALYELYLRPFHAAVVEGGAWSVMGSYNQYLNQHATHNARLINDILKKEWGFDGFVVSDCGAIGVVNWQHRMVNSLEETVALCVNSGCDLECGDIYRDKLVNAVHQGLITEDVIDRALTRVLTARFKLGEFDSIQSVPYNHYDKKLLAGKEFSALAYEAAVKSLVLLKNDNHFLPVDKNKVRSVAVIGPFADNNYLGGYSGHPVNNISLLKGVRELLGSQVDISYLEGTSVVEPISERYLLAADKKTHGLTAEYIASENIQDNPLFEQCDTTINFEWGDESPDKRLNKDNFSIRWHGYLKSPVSGERILGIYADGGIRIWMDGVLILDEWDSHSLHYYTAKVQLEKGKAIPLKVEYVNRTGAATCILTSDFSHLERMEDIKKTISGKDLVLVALGSDWKLARENRDLPSIYLPMAQEQMLKEICKTNPNATALIAAAQ